jgi:2-polyprenyl-3-methyl-5-hydroxy-6-metoxy-1,4-benzoquinol methylase
MKAEIYDPAPELAAKYIELLPQLRVNPVLAEWAADYARGHAGRCRWDARFVAGELQVHQILNIGGAPYLFEMIVRNEKPEIAVVSVDLEPDRFPGAASTLGIRVICGNIENTDWGIAEKFDCIVFAEILEHLRIDLLGTLTRIRDLLKPEGILYLTTPNGLSFWNIFKHFLQGRTGPSPIVEWEKLSRLGHMGHVREYSVTEVRELLTSCGFVVDRTIFRSSKDGRWPLRDLLISRRAAFAGEIVMVARAVA